MPKGKKAKGKKIEPVPAVMMISPLFEKRSKNFSTGQDIQPQRNLTHFAEWPTTFGHSSKGLFYKCLQVPPAINQFTQVLDCQTTTQLLKLAHKYRPEVKLEKQRRLLARAEKTAASQGDVPTKRPPVLEQGLTSHHPDGEQEGPAGSDAHDVDPIELLIFLVPRAIRWGSLLHQGGGQAGHLVHRKTYTTVTFTQVNMEDKGVLAKLVEAIWTNYDEMRSSLTGSWVQSWWLTLPS